MLIGLQVGDLLRLRKPHPCGSTDWVVTRIGADIGIKCLGCGRYLLLPRRELARRLKKILTEEDRPSQPKPDTE
ncbi:MAG: DUF951 domain-containing protein [Anaerolineales bacterium]|nr:DUF951 domain-containing protein [Anaerolineales bacterium]